MQYSSRNLLMFRLPARIALPPTLILHQVTGRGSRSSVRTAPSRSMSRVGKHTTTDDHGLLHDTRSQLTTLLRGKANGICMDSSEAQLLKLYMLGSFLDRYFESDRPTSRVMSAR